ncbi:S1 family peptidase [Microbacterium enclense]|uniref:S1 family peptidase n=1 Tax=Microbacterium enclense TaxID=993073 RepID=UPI003F818FE3
MYAAVTTESARSAAADAGAVPVSAAHSLDDLKSVVDRIGDGAVPASVTSWGIDVAANVVSIDVLHGGETAAAAYVASLGAPADAVRLDTAPAALSPREDLRGGIAYYTSSSRCSIGFTVQGGFVTAGHCGGTGEGTNVGTFEGSSFPENDYAWVSTGDRSLIGAVEDWNGGTVAVKGSDPAPVGATVCRSGSTTGWHCGQIEAYDTSVQYGSNTVNGLIQTNVCSEPGDSGGSLIAGDQAQGVTSGGWGDCTSGGQTWLQPVNEILDAYNLTLLTS